jgi:hypothetical protein
VLGSAGVDESMATANRAVCEFFFGADGGGTCCRARLALRSPPRTTQRDALAASAVTLQSAAE